MPRHMLSIALLLTLTACSGDPLKGARAALAGGDLAAAEAQLDQVVAEESGLIQARVLRFALYRRQALLGPPEKQSHYLDKSIEEYDRIAAHYKLALDYKDMEASLKSHPDCAAQFADAHKSIFGE